jgi:hypothetical protein
LGGAKWTRRLNFEVPPETLAVPDVLLSWAKEAI